MNSILSAAVSANGGPLSQADVANLLTGPNGLASVFSNTNSNPAQNYNQASTPRAMTATDDGGDRRDEDLQYNASANQPAFQDLVYGCRC